MHQAPSTDTPPAKVRGATPAAIKPPPAYLNARQAASLVFGVSERKFHELRKEEWMPKPFVLGPRLLRWSRVELEAAFANMPRQQAKAPEPEKLVRGKRDKAVSA